jgi:hypothetical protein
MDRQDLKLEELPIPEPVGLALHRTAEPVVEERSGEALARLLPELPQVFAWGPWPAVGRSWALGG